MYQGYKKNLYDKNVYILKKYGDKYQLILLNSVRKKGFEVANVKSRAQGFETDKLDNSISRTKSKIFELAICNEWEYFLTLTINKDKYNRYDLKKYYKDFAQWLQNYNKKYNIKIDYIMIPELHQDGAWHMHGLVKGIPKKHFTKNEHGYLDWKEYREKFGYFSCSKIKSKEKVSKYITKYITKDMDKSVKELNANMYYRSQGLNEAETIKKGHIYDYSVQWDYKNDYVQLKWLADHELNKIIELIE